MPDGDIIHSKLGYLYQKPYKWLCEGKASSQECARAAMQALLKDIKKKGNEPIKLAKRMGSTINQFIDNVSKNGVVNWATLSAKLNRLAQQTRGSHNAKELVFCAVKEVIHDLRYHKIGNTKNLSEIVVERYIRKVYQSNFEECIPLTYKHHAGVDTNTLESRIQAINSDVLNAITHFANKANICDGLEKIRLPNRRKTNGIKEIDLEENLL